MQVHRQSQPVTCEYRLAERGACRSGRTPRPRSALPRSMRETMVPHLDHEGQLEGWEGMVQDISEQRSLADDLRARRGCSTRWSATCRRACSSSRGRTASRSWSTPAPANCSATRELRRWASSTWPRSTGCSARTARPTRRRSCRCTGDAAGATSMREDIVVHRLDGQRVPLVTWAAPIHLGAGEGRCGGVGAGGPDRPAPGGGGAPARAKHGCGP